MIDRIIYSNLVRKLRKGKTIVVLGPRQVGKTTLIKLLVKDLKNALWLNAENQEVQLLFRDLYPDQLEKKFRGISTLVIDEAQLIKKIGIKLRSITEELPHIQLIIIGSSTIEFAQEIDKQLTGKKWEYQLFPLSFQEMANNHGLIEEKRLLFHRLVYGYYPDVAKSDGDEKEIVKQITDRYLFRDINGWKRINKSEKIFKLLKALAFQVGQPVSYNELGKTIGLNNETIEAYIEILEKAYIIFRLRSFSRNLPVELKKSRKIYFYDNGIRNALIENFQQPPLRKDSDALWENFLISERYKHLSYKNIKTNNFFWGTKDQQEIDYLEENDGQISAYEFKWKPTNKTGVTKTFTKAYPEATVQIITPSNYIDFITG